MHHPASRARRSAVRALAALSLAVVASCAPAAVQPVDTSTRSLVYGHIEASKPIQSVRLAKMLSAHHPWAHVTENGDFFFENVGPGTYALMEFYAGGERYILLGRDTTSNKRFIVKPTPGGIHFIGSWKVTGTKNNTFSPDEFSIDRIPSPDAKTVLARLKPALAGSGWEAKVGGGTAKKSGR